MQHKNTHVGDKIILRFFVFFLEVCNNIGLRLEGGVGMRTGLFCLRRVHTRATVSSYT
jgi:hypothetical protein